MGNLPKSWIKAAVAITPGFEVSGDPYVGVSGDFDKMGISCGALQWNIGKGSLQPMVKSAGKAVVTASMPSLGNNMWDACNSPVKTGLEIVRGWQNGTKLRPKAKAELTNLMGSKEMRDQQDNRISVASENAANQARTWCDESGSETNIRFFCWFFDLITQNGGLKSVSPGDVEDFKSINKPDLADDAVCNYLQGLEGKSGHIKDANKNAALWRNKAKGDQLDLLCMSYLRSGEANPTWRHVVLNRKASIAMGGGWVNSEFWDFSKFGL